MTWYLYIIETINDKLYTGITKDLDRRFNEHLNGKGARFTKANPPKNIVYTELYKTRSEASKREYEIKKLSRKDKELLITSQ